MINAVARYARLWYANTGSTAKAVAEMRVFGAPTPPQSVSKYYFLGKQRVAMRQNGKLTYLHGDQLGSASLATDAAGATISQQRYLPYGGLRWAQSGSVFPTPSTSSGQAAVYRPTAPKHTPDRHWHGRVLRLPRPDV